jgi:hypothetical protein
MRPLLFIITITTGQWLSQRTGKFCLNLQGQRHKQIKMKIKGEPLRQMKIKGANGPMSQ